MAGSSTAIGSASVVLSANADRLADGLDSAERKVGDFARDVDRKLDKVGEGGGFFKKLLGGAAIGGVAGLAAGAAKGFVELLGNIPDIFERLKEKATGADKAGLQGIEDSISRIIGAAEQLGTKLFLAFGPAVSRAADIVLDLVDRFAPHIDAALDRLSTFAFVAVEVFGEVWHLIADGIDAVTEWAAETLGLATTTGEAGDQIFQVFRLVGKGIAYVWDTLKAGAGIMAQVAGVIIEGFGSVVRVIGDAVQKVADLARELPEDIRPGWIDGAADTVKGWGDSIDRVGERWRKWGEGALGAWGRSAADVDRWFDGVQDRLRQKRADAIAEAAADVPKLGGAFLKDSTQAFSVVAKHETAGMAAQADVPKKMLAAELEAVRVLKDVLSTLRGVPGLGAF